MKNPFSKIISLIWPKQGSQTIFEARFDKLEALIQGLNVPTQRSSEVEELRDLLAQQQKQISEMKDQILRVIQSKACNLTVIEQHFGQLEKLIKDFHLPANNGGKDEKLNDLLSQQHEKITQLQSDLFYRMMRQYIFDTYTHLYTVLAHESYKRGREKERDNFLTIVKTEMNSIGVSFESSKSGQPFDPHKMEVSQFPSQPTSDQKLNGCVATSVIPYMTWNITSSKEQKAIPIKKEEVILYSYPKNTILEEPSQSENVITAANVQTDNLLNPVNEPQIVHPTGFFIQCRGENINDITCLYPILPGTNIIGTVLRKSSDAKDEHLCRLSLPKNNSAPFSVAIVNEDEEFHADVIQGEWGVNSKENHQKKYTLNSRDIIFINDVKFVFIVA